MYTELDIHLKTTGFIHIYIYVVKIVIISDKYV